MNSYRAIPIGLLVGDAVSVLVVTLLGFLDHYGMLAGSRWLTSYLPALAAWLMIAPWLGVYRSDLSAQPRQVWRVVLAALFAAPLAATFRGLWLSAAVLPVFVLVLGATNALGLLMWRLIWALWIQGKRHRMEEYG